MINILFFISVAILFYFLLLMLGSAFLLMAAFPGTLRTFKELEYGNVANLVGEQLLPVTVIVPMYNQENRILNTLYSLLNSNYKNVQIILVNDASTDRTLALLTEELSLYEVLPVFKQVLKTALLRHCFKSHIYPNVTVIDKEHGSAHNAADALNMGINACHTPLHVTVDADTLLEAEALSRIVFTFLSEPHCLAVGGAVYVLNENKIENGRLLETNIPRHFITGVQSIEYIRSFLYGRVGWNPLGGALCHAGAFTLFETQAVRDVGGLDTDNASYDAEIIIKLNYQMRMNKTPYAICYTPGAVAWTEVPATLRAYWKQRNFWQRGMLRGCFRHIGAFFNFKYGIFGLFSLPNYLLFETLGPVVEFISYVLFFITFWMGIVSFELVQWLFALAWGYIVFLSVVVIFMNAITFNRYHRPLDIFRTFLLVSAEMIGFREYRALCCFVATIQYFINRLKGKPE